MSDRDEFIDPEGDGEAARIPEEQTQEVKEHRALIGKPGYHGADRRYADAIDRIKTPREGRE